MTRGRKPKPTQLRAAEGNRGKRALNRREPRPPDRMPDCPAYLDDAARGEWDRVAALLREMQLLTEADATALAAYCSAYSRWLHAEDQVRKFGPIVKSPVKGFPMKSPYLTMSERAVESMRKFMVEFGLTPSSRSRIHLHDAGCFPASGMLKKAAKSRPN